MMANRILVTLGCAILIALTVGCETPTQQGALMGGALGAGAGAIIGNQSHGRGGQGALIGAGVGALTGALVGDQVEQSRKRGYAQGQAASRQAVSGHYENRIVRTPTGETYEERVWVPDR
jgi:uncharacterized protein YcfJ